MFRASSISAASLYVLAAVKTDSAFTDHTTGFVPPSSTTVTPAEAPLTAISCWIEIARPPTPRGTTKEVNVEKMPPTCVVVPLPAPCFAWTSTAPTAIRNAMAIAGSSLCETCRRTIPAKPEVGRWDSAATALRNRCEPLGSLESFGSPQSETKGAVERDMRDPGQTGRQPGGRAQGNTAAHQRGRLPVAMHGVLDRHRTRSQLPALDAGRKLSRDRETETSAARGSGTRWVGAVEAVEHLLWIRLVGDGLVGHDHLEAGNVRQHRDLDRGAFGCVLDRVVEKVVDDLVQALQVRGHRSDVRRHAQVQLQLAQHSPWPDDLELLL